MTSPVLLAAYGTLMTGQRNGLDAGIRSRLRDGRACLIDGALYEVHDVAGRLAYPGMISGLAGAGPVVHGELFEIGADMADAAAVLDAIDRYEECFPDDPDASMFRRILLPIRFAGAAGRVSAWTYVYNRPVDQLRRIVSGRWIAAV